MEIFNLTVCSTLLHFVKVCRKCLLPQTNEPINREGSRDRKTKTHGETKTERQVNRDKNREAEKHRQRQKETDRETQRQR
jgi:hypothetical protein